MGSLSQMPYAYVFRVIKNEEKRKVGGQGEFSVGLAARRDVASQPAM
jgi:hypothetical protein